MCFSTPKVPEIPPPAPPPDYNPQLAPQLRDQTPEARSRNLANTGLAMQPRLDLLIPTGNPGRSGGIFIP